MARRFKLFFIFFFILIFGFVRPAQAGFLSDILNVIKRIELVISQPVALERPRVQFVKDGFPTDSIICGEKFTIEILNYEKPTVWLTQSVTKDGQTLGRYDGEFPVPLTYISNCSSDPGVYRHKFYFLNNGAKWEEIGSFTFTIYPKEGVKTPEPTPRTVPPETATPTPERRSPTPTQQSENTCSFRVNKTEFKIGEKIEISITSTPVNLDAFWFGTGITSKRGVYAGITPFNLSYEFKSGDEGTYLRYAVIKDGLGNSICETEKITIKVSSSRQTLTPMSVPTRTVLPSPSSDFIKNSLNPGTSFQWSSLKGGIRKTDNNYYYEDFALVVMSTNSQPTNVNIRLVGDVTYSKDLTLEKDKTFQFLASEHFDLSEEALAFHENLSLNLSSSAPVYVFSPFLFKTNGTGKTLEEAVKNGWWGSFTLDIPHAIDGNRIIFPYAIHWHNFENWPEGWDSLITVKNKSSRGGNAVLANKMIYNNIQNAKNNCRDVALPDKEVGYFVRARRQVSVYLSDFLGVNQARQSHNSEGAIMVTVPNINLWEAYLKVISLPSGTKLCPK